MNRVEARTGGSVQSLWTRSNPTATLDSVWIHLDGDIHDVELAMGDHRKLSICFSPLYHTSTRSLFTSSLLQQHECVRKV